MHGKGRATFLIPTQGSSSETNTGCQIQLCNRTFHCGGNGAAFSLSSFRFWGAPDSWDWTLTWPTCHVWLVWTLSASVCGCVCVWVSVCAWWKWWSGISHGGSGLSRPAARPLCVPGEASVFMGKSQLHFRRHSRGLYACVGNTENSNTRLTWGHPSAKHRRGHSQPCSEECCFAVTDCQKLP